MARPLAIASPDGSAPARRGGETACGVYYRTLVDLDTGGVAGIEAVHGREGRRDPVWSAWPGSVQGLRPSAAEPLGAWGREVREPAACLVRGDLATRPDTLGASLGVSAERVIVMFDVAVLLRTPVRALDLLLACKRAGSRILLDNFSLDDPPARFMEMLPADILRVAPWSMPWHWDDGQREEGMASLLGFAGNLLMDVAVEGVEGETRRKFKRLGVRYAQGGWRKDSRGLGADPVRP